MFDPSTYHRLSAADAERVRQISKFTEEYFQDPKFDASHDFNHVLRVTALALRIFEKESAKGRAVGKPAYDPLTVVVGALMHDVDDKKYRAGYPEAVPQAQKELLRIGFDEAQAERLQLLIDGVSYSSEVKDPQRVRDLLVTIPELAIVQDADRLDAIGAIGAGRCFAYGAAKTSRDLSGTVAHFDEKLFKIVDMMKTETGRNLAAIYTYRLRLFKCWWDEEIEFADSLP